MSFEELAKRTAGTPEAAAHAAARASEVARKPFHDAFLADVYPHWQGPLTTISRTAGVESATHAPVPGFVAAENASDAQRLLTRSDWVVSEVLAVSHAHGLRAVVAYAFAGDVNDGTLARVAGCAEKGEVVLLLNQTKQWSGPIAKLMEAAEADIAAASPLFGQLLVAALDAREDRLADEAEAAAKAEAARVQAEQDAAEEAERAKTEAAEAEERRQKSAAEALEE